MGGSQKVQKSADVKYGWSQRELEDDHSCFGGSTRKWKECHFARFGSTNVERPTKSLYGMTYYSNEYCTSTFDYSLDISVHPTNKPRGPSYDNECATYKTPSKINTNGNNPSPSGRSSTMEVNIKQYKR